ncbi:unnamed protein product [Mesocestoides corti]|uniref:Uncharacterized protein n=2 Tax=Mesocestoides corti TaxID=53468 RepID=A0A0R3UQB0_MESCO|nr:unnamed protein product [Mesocestoides corti]
MGMGLSRRCVLRTPQKCDFGYEALSTWTSTHRFSASPVFALILIQQHVTRDMGDAKTEWFLACLKIRLVVWANCWILHHVTSRAHDPRVDDNDGSLRIEPTFTTTHGHKDHCTTNTRSCTCSGSAGSSLESIRLPRETILKFDHMRHVALPEGAEFESEPETRGVERHNGMVQHPNHNTGCPGLLNYVFF